jgi:hypothetical protein
LAFGSGDRTDWLAVGQASGTLRLGTWNAGKWEMILAKPSAGQDEGALHAVAFSPQGAILAGLSESGVRLWQLKDLSVERQSSNGP